MDAGFLVHHQANADRDRAEIARLRAALQQIADGAVFPQMLAKGVLLPERQKPE